MLNGTPDEIEAATWWCLDTATEGGGFVLSTGDQCARDTPEANIERLVETAHRYGRYGRIHFWGKRSSPRPRGRFQC